MNSKLSKKEMDALDEIFAMVDENELTLSEHDIDTLAEIDESERFFRAKKKGTGTPHEI
jgi:hypothetical protein